MPESAVAGYLTELAAEVAGKGVKVGSYPRWGKKNNSVTLVGRDRVFRVAFLSKLGGIAMRLRVTVVGVDDEP